MKSIVKLEAASTRELEEIAEYLRDKVNTQDSKDIEAYQQSLIAKELLNRADRSKRIRIR